MILSIFRKFSIFHLLNIKNIRDLAMKGKGTAHPHLNTMPLVLSCIQPFLSLVHAMPLVSSCMLLLLSF